jgi:hypothetical protein
MSGVQDKSSVTSLPVSVGRTFERYLPDRDPPPAAKPFEAASEEPIDDASKRVSDDGEQKRNGELAGEKTDQHWLRLHRQYRRRTESGGKKAEVDARSIIVRREQPLLILRPWKPWLCTT